MNRIHAFTCFVVLTCLAALPTFAGERDADESRRAFMKRFDANGDGKVTKEESKSVLEKEAKQRAIKRKADESRRAFMKRFDANDDGKVTKEEAKSVLEKEAERRAIKRKADESRRTFIKRFDANGDGKVTKEEAKSVLEKEAERRAKGDGKVTKNEINATLQRTKITGGKIAVINSTTTREIPQHVTLKKVPGAASFGISAIRIKIPGTGFAIPLVGGKVMPVIIRDHPLEV